MPRFAHSGGGLKLLVITFLSLLTKLAVQLIEQEGIIIIEVGEKLTSEFYRNLKKLYTLGNKIHKAVTNFWKQKLQPKSSINITNISQKSEPLFSNSPNQQSQLITVDNVNSNITRTHDTPILSYSDIEEFIKEYSQILKREETQRLRKLYG